MKMNFQWIVFALWASMSAPAYTQNCQGLGCQATSESSASLKVMRALAIENISPLDFGTAVAGSSEQKVEAGETESLDNASFVVTGQPNSLFTIILPGQIFMSKSGTNARRIKVDRFVSYPGYSGSLDQRGKRMLYVGATRESLPINTEPGDYRGSFEVSVVY
jgi:hypothetical protein